MNAVGTPEAAPRAQVLLSTGCLFHLPLPSIAAMATAAGFDGLELIVNSPELKPGPAMEALHAACPVRSLHAPFRQWSKWGGHLGAYKATAVLANFLPAVTNVTLHPPGSSMAEIIGARWFSKAHDLGHVLDALGRVRFSLENLPWDAADASPFARDPMDELIKECRAKNVGMTFDVCHLGVSGCDPVRTLARVPGDLLQNIHFSDAAGHREHLYPGDGYLPLGAFLKALAARGYDRYITVEVQPGVLPDEPENICEALADLRHWIRDVLENEGRGAKAA